MDELKKRWKERAQHPSVWAFITYFAEGFPYMIVHLISSLFFTYNNVKLELLGLTSLYHLPWNIKFLWSTWIDQFGTKRKWIILIEFGLLIVAILLAIFAPLSFGLKIAAVLFLVMAFFSATHDVAIDGYYLEKLDKEGQAKWVGFRVMAYRIAMLVVSSGIVIVAGISWTWAFWAIAGILLLLFLYNLFILPKAEKEVRKLSELLKLPFIVFNHFLNTPLKHLLYTLIFAVVAILIGYSSHYSVIKIFGKENLAKAITVAMFEIVLIVLVALPFIKKKLYKSESFFAKSFVSLLDQPRIPCILMFIILYRLGETLLLAMKSPFFKGIGVTLSELGIANGIFGIIASIVGGLVGGWLISKYSLKKMIWPFVLSQNLLNFLYMFAAMFYSDIYFEGAVRPVGLANANFFVVSAVIAIEAFGAGLGTAVFMVYIMRCVKKSYKASHTAFWTAIMSISVLITGPMSGVLAQDYGFTTYFGLTFLATIPGMILIFFIPYLDGTSASDHDKDA